MAHSSNEAAAEAVKLKIIMPDNRQVDMTFRSTDTVWAAKQKLFGNSSKVLADSQNYGLYVPACNGRGEKYLDDERMLKEYAITDNASELVLKYKQRINYGLSLSYMKIKKMNTASNQRDFLELVKRNDVERVDRILNGGLDPNFNVIMGETPLTICAILPKPRSMMITLVGGGAFLDFRNKRGQTPLHTAAFKENKEAVRSLLDLGSSPNYKDSNGLTPMFYCASYNKDVQCLNMLLHERAEVDCRDAQGWTELHHACKRGNTAIVEQLIFYGADVNATSRDGNTPMHISSKFNQEASCRALLLRGADKMVKNMAGMLPSDLASMNKHDDIYKLINGFKSSDVVLFTEMPTYNDKRRGTLSMATIKNIARSRSIPNINTLFSDPINPNSTISISSLNNFQTNDFLVKSSVPNHRISAMDLTWNDKSKTEDNSTENSTTFEGFEELTFILQKTGDATFGFTLKGTNDSPGSENTFKITPKTPARNFIAGVEVGKLADEMGMRDGDFLVEINGTKVSEQPHSFCVDTIVKSGKYLRLKVLRKAKILHLMGVNETSSNCEGSINKDLQATLDNFDKILTSSPSTSHEGHSLSPSSSSASNNEINTRIQPSVSIDQSNSSVPAPPPLPILETLGKSHQRSSTMFSTGEDSIDNIVSNRSSPRPGTTPVGGLPNAAHDALMEAIRRRRELVDNVDQNRMSESIENRISKTKKLGLNISSANKPTNSTSAAIDKVQPGSLLSPVSPEAKTLPKSFKKAHNDLAKRGSLGDNLDQKGLDEAEVQSKTLPKKSDILSSTNEASGDFLAVAEMLRQKFIKKKLQNLNGSQFSLNDANSNHTEEELEPRLENEVSRQIEIKEISADSPTVPEFPNENKISVKPLTIKEDEQIENHQAQNAETISFPQKNRVAPPPPKKPLGFQSNQSAEQIKTATQAEVNLMPNASPTNGLTGSGNHSVSSPVVQSPVSFGDLASLVAEKAALLHKVSEEKGILFPSQPPASGTTKRYTRSTETKTNLAKSSSDQPSQKTTNNFTENSLTPSASAIIHSPKKKLFPSEGSSVSEMTKMFSSAAHSRSKVIQPAKPTAPRSTSQDRIFSQKDLKLQSTDKLKINASKSSYASTNAINMVGTTTTYQNFNNISNKKDFKEAPLIPPPSEFASDFGTKINGGDPVIGIKSDVTPSSTNKITIYNSTSPKTSDSDQMPTSPDTMFPTLRKTSQQPSNTMVFKAKKI